MFFQYPHYDATTSPVSAIRQAPTRERSPMTKIERQHLMAKSTWRLGVSALCVVALIAFIISSAAPQIPNRPPGDGHETLKDFGATGNGQADDTLAIQRAVDAGIGSLRFEKGIYRITKPIEIDLEKVGYTSIQGDGTAQILMAGPGPAFRFVGTHAGTAAPSSVKPDVWDRQRSPFVDGIEIVGGHPEACGIEAKRTMQLTLTRVVVREALHGIHLAGRNRNVMLSECHIYNNKGIGVYLDRLNLHQINIANCHISYNRGGGVVSRESEIRNLQIGTSDIEGNMGGESSEPTANVLLDSTGSSIGEVAIVGCTIQHAHGSPGSANIRILGESLKVPFTEELRHGNITIADNVLSDVQVNIDLRNTRGVTITGNTLWKGFSQNLLVEGCQNIIVANNVFDRNPRYHYGDGGDAKLGLVFINSSDCTISGNHLHGLGNQPAAILLRRCQRMNITGCSILNFGPCGLWLDEVTGSRVSDCLIQTDAPAEGSVSVRATKSLRNLIVDNLLGSRADLNEDVGVVRDNYLSGDKLSPLSP
jgi:hypothetical protein